MSNDKNADILKEFPEAIFISANSKLSVETLIKKCSDWANTSHRTQTYHIPYEKMHIVDLLFKKGHILSQKYLDTEIELKVNINKVLADKIMGQLHADD